MLDVDSLGYYHNQLMGWTTTHASADVYDTFVRLPIMQFSAKMATDHAKTIGWGMSVVYPHESHIPRRLYSDNFKWKGLPVKPEDEEDY